MAMVLQIGMDEVLKLQEKGDEQAYQDFKDKFKPKKTTDDCYTPALVMDAVNEWVAKEYRLNPATFVRPFWPGGDYEAFDYPEGCTVVDNPPFSILAGIINFYEKRGIRFFLFAPALTLFSARHCDCSYLAAGADVTYENGAEVKTSFITNLDTCRVRTCPELFRMVEEANKRNQQDAKGDPLPKYEYPDEIITAAIVQKWTRYGIDFRVDKDACVRVSGLDSQKESGKSIYGGGYLLSERAAAERAAATRWKLSEREQRIIAGLR